MSAPRNAVRVAVLGAGITGSAVALLLARRGVAVTLFDAAAEPFGGASRWNEGKIHLGHLYSADPTLATAHRLLPGGLAFGPLVEDLLGASIADAVTQHDDTYAVHRDSVASADAMGAYFDAVTRLAAAHPGARGYLTDVRGARVRRLSRAECDARYDAATIAAAFVVPERSVATTRIADRFVAALRATPRIELRCGHRVVALRRDGGVDAPIDVIIAGERAAERFDIVVNATWESRLALDAGLGLVPPTHWSHRYRVSAFVHTRDAHAVPSTVIAAGPFGDLKNYDGRHFYLSWYPAGLLRNSGTLAPPSAPQLSPDDRAAIAAAIRAGLGDAMPSARALLDDAQSLRIEGGWVYAAGDGALSDPAATLHRRDRVGLRVDGAYLSIDTGKYSIGPWLAHEAARVVLAKSGSDAAP